MRGQGKGITMDGGGTVTEQDSLGGCPGWILKG